MSCERPAILFCPSSNRDSSLLPPLTLKHTKTKSKLNSTDQNADLHFTCT